MIKTSSSLGRKAERYEATPASNRIFEARYWNINMFDPVNQHHIFSMPAREGSISSSGLIKLIEILCDAKIIDITGIKSFETAMLNNIELTSADQIEMAEAFNNIKERFSRIYKTLDRKDR